MILLARHGETDDNRPPLRFQGRRDTPMNDLGREQARALADAARAGGVRALWTSPLARAAETAAIVGAALGLEAREDARLVEGFRGRWEGRLMRDVEREEPDLYAAWRRPDPGWRFPGGESLAEHQARVLAALADVRSAPGPGPALVICHGGSIRVLLCAQDPRGLAAFHTWELPNATIVAA